MSTQSICLPAESREQFGKAEIRRMRRLQDKMPAIIYGAGQAVVPVSIEHRHILKALSNEAVYSQILELDIDGKKEKVVLKALQRHPYKPKIMHADFLRVSAKQKLHMQTPLHFINEEDSPAVKAGGVFTHVLTEVSVVCLPSDLPEFIEVDLSGVELDSAVHLSDLTLPSGIELEALSAEEPNDAVIASVHIQKVIEESEPEAESSEEAEAEQEGIDGAESGSENSDDDKSPESKS